MGEKYDPSEVFRRAAPYLSLGTTFAASIVLGLVGGYWLDGKLSTRPWLTLVGALLGLTVGFYNFLVTVLRQPPPD